MDMSMSEATANDDTDEFIAILRVVTSRDT